MGVIGAGRFGTMFLAQARQTPGMHIVGVVDAAPGRARCALRKAGWSDADIGATSVERALRDSTTCAHHDAAELIAAAGLDVVVEATGDPRAGVEHALMCVSHGRHIVMGNVEADALAGPVLAQRALAAGVVYSLAYGDQPALICELVDWARTCGLEVVCAGKGTRYLPGFERSTPDDVWLHYGISAEEAAEAGLNRQMFNSFVDGTKSAVEMAAVANAAGLQIQERGLGFPPAGVDSVADVCHSRQTGGCLDRDGTVEVVSCLQRDGAPVPRDLRWGVYVTFRTDSEYATRALAAYGVQMDRSLRYGALYRPVHLVGLEVGVSVATAALAQEATGVASAFCGDVVAVAKRDLAVGEILDGEGGFAVWGRLVAARKSVGDGCLPIGLAGGARVTRPVARGDVLTWRDVALEREDVAVSVRRELERWIAPASGGAREERGRAAAPPVQT